MLSAGAATMNLFEAVTPGISMGGSPSDTSIRSQCNWCDFTSCSQMVMSTHERALHSAEMSASFFCTFCPAKLSSAVGLHLHTSRKHGVSHLPGWPAQSTRGKRNGDSIRPMSERNLGDGWVVGDTLEGARVQYKADFYVNAFHTVGDGYVRLELLGPHCSIASQSNPTYLHELNRILEETGAQEDREPLDDIDELKIDDIEFKQKLIDSHILELQDQRQSLKMMTDDQQASSGYSCTINETFRETAVGRGENRPPKEYFCASCSFSTKYSSSLRRHTSKMHKFEGRRQH